MNPDFVVLPQHCGSFPERVYRITCALSQRAPESDGELLELKSEATGLSLLSTYSERRPGRGGSEFTERHPLVKCQHWGAKMNCSCSLSQTEKKRESGDKNSERRVPECRGAVRSVTGGSLNQHSGGVLVHLGCCNRMP